MDFDQDLSDLGTGFSTSFFNSRASGDPYFVHRMAFIFSSGLINTALYDRVYLYFPIVDKYSMNR